MITHSPTLDSYENIFKQHGSKYADKQLKALEILLGNHSLHLNDQERARWHDLVINCLRDRQSPLLHYQLCVLFLQIHIYGEAEEVKEQVRDIVNDLDSEILESLRGYIYVMTDADIAQIFKALMQRFFSSLSESSSSSDNCPFFPNEMIDTGAKNNLIIFMERFSRDQKIELARQCLNNVCSQSADSGSLRKFFYILIELSKHDSALHSLIETDLSQNLHVVEGKSSQQTKMMIWDFNECLEQINQIAKPNGKVSLQKWFDSMRSAQQNNYPSIISALEKMVQERDQEKINEVSRYLIEIMKNPEKKAQYCGLLFPLLATVLPYMMNPYRREVAYFSINNLMDKDANYIDRRYLVGFVGRLMLEYKDDELSLVLKKSNECFDQFPHTQVEFILSYPSAIDFNKREYLIFLNKTYVRCFDDFLKDFPNKPTTKNFPEKLQLMDAFLKIPHIWSDASFSQMINALITQGGSAGYQDEAYGNIAIMMACQVYVSASGTFPGLTMKLFHCAFAEANRFMSVDPNVMEALLKLRAVSKVEKITEAINKLWKNLLAKAQQQVGDEIELDTFGSLVNFSDLMDPSSLESLSSMMVTHIQILEAQGPYAGERVYRYWLALVPSLPVGYARETRSMLEQTDNTTVIITLMKAQLKVCISEHEYQARLLSGTNSRVAGPV